MFRRSLLRLVASVGSEVSSCGRSFVLGAFRVRGVVVADCLSPPWCRRCDRAWRGREIHGRPPACCRAAWRSRRPAPRRWRLDPAPPARGPGRGRVGGKICDSDATLATALTSRRDFDALWVCKPRAIAGRNNFSVKSDACLFGRLAFEMLSRHAMLEPGKNCLEHFKTRANKHFPIAGRALRGRGRHL